MYGHHYLAQGEVDWWLPENLVDRKAFITVGAIHNSSYLGGLLGLTASIFYLILLNRKARKKLSVAPGTGNEKRYSV